MFRFLPLRRTLSTVAPVMTARTEKLVNGVLARDRTSLSRAITLVESTNPVHHVQAQLMLSACVQQRPRRIGYAREKRAVPTVRVGISGSPGAGKSTLIEALGMQLVNAGERVAVLAIDPSSSLSGGSILGDKTRMEQLSRHPSAFIRPSANRGTLGGVAANTADAITLCEASGYSVVIVETVGVGQSEIMVADMVDVFLLLVSPAGGDDLQGLKRGIVEMADIVAVNKCDGELVAAARLASQNYASSMRLMQPRTKSWKPRAITMSARDNTGLTDLWKHVEECVKARAASGELQEIRKDQRQKQLWNDVTHTLLNKLRDDGRAAASIQDLEREVLENRMAPGLAAELIVRSFLGTPR